MTELALQSCTLNTCLCDQTTNLAYSDVGQQYTIPLITAQSFIDSQIPITLIKIEIVGVHSFCLFAHRNWNQVNTWSTTKFLGRAYCYRTPLKKHIDECYRNASACVDILANTKLVETWEDLKKNLIVVAQHSTFPRRKDSPVIIRTFYTIHNGVATTADLSVPPPTEENAIKQCNPEIGYWGTI